MRPIADRLRSPDWDTFLGAVQDAIAAGEDGDILLAGLLAETAQLSADRLLLIVMALGEVTGATGLATLHKLLDKPDTDPRLLGQSVLALAKRCGASASADFAKALRTGDENVKEWAVVSLAGAGDDRAWDDVFARVERHLRHGTRLVENAMNDTTGLCYLARHVGAAGRERSAKLVDLIRNHWDNLNSDERAWLNQYWPESCPSGPAAESVAPPDPEALIGWARGYFESYLDILKTLRSGD